MTKLLTIITILILGVLIYGYNHTGGFRDSYVSPVPMGSMVREQPTSTPAAKRTKSVPSPRQPTLSPMHRLQPELGGGATATPTHRAATPYTSEPTAWICQPQYNWDCETAKRIAWCESKYDPTERNPSGATGLFQIMLPLWSGLMHGGDPYDPLVNTQAAYELWSLEGWRPWACY